MEKIAALYNIFKNIKKLTPNTHCALLQMERIKRAFFFYGPDIMWYGRKEELEDLFDRFVFAENYTNEWGHKGFTFNV